MAATKLTADRIALLELDVDIRLADLWPLADVVEEWSLPMVFEFVRSAYVTGYMEAACGDRTLFTEHGYEVPERCR